MPKKNQSKGQRETMTIRVTSKTNVAVNMVVNELKVVKPGRRITQDEAIWLAIRQSYPHIAARVEELLASEEFDDEEPS